MNDRLTERQKYVPDVGTPSYLRGFKTIDRPLFEGIETIQEKSANYVD